MGPVSTDICVVKVVAIVPKFPTVGGVVDSAEDNQIVTRNETIK